MLKKIIGILFSSFQALLAKSAFFSKVYLLFFGAVLRTMGDNYFSKRMINRIASTRWPELRFSARKVWLCEGASIGLIPHVGEFDFRALFSNKLAYEAHLFSWLLPKMKEFDAVVEIGANVGVYSVFFAKYGQGIPVYCFEPSKRAFFRLLANLDDNEVVSANPINSAVSEQNGFITFYEPAGHLTNGSLEKTFASQFSDELTASTVPTVSGLDVLELAKKHQSILLKIDVEGAEHRILRSLESLIIEKKPVIIMEVLETIAMPLNELDFIKEHYRFYLITGCGLQQKTQFEADSQFRDYCLLPHHREFN